MRTILAAVALAIALVTPSFAQDGKGTAPTPALAAQTPAPSAAAVAASREMLQFIFVESGAIDLALNRAFEAQMPQIRSEFAASAGYRQMSPAERQRIDTFLDTLPQIAREEFMGAMPRILDETAAESATLFTEAEIVEIATFMRTSEVRTVLGQYVLQGVERSIPGVTPRAITITAAQQDALDAFERTQGGQAFVRNMSPWTEVVERHLSSLEGELSNSMERRTLEGFCDAMGRDCPREIRRQIDRLRT